MASYLNAPDYQTYVTSQYQLPVAQIMGAMGARDAYWNLGASQLRNAKEHYLGLELLRPDNKERLDTLMKDVNKNLTKVVQTDVSLAANVTDGLKVFDPVNKDQNIMGDHALAQHYKSQMNLADSYRTRDNGKEYNDANVNYVLKGMNKFISDSDAGNWRAHYSKRRTYTPYHDTAGEIKSLLKDFKPSSTSSSVPDIDPKTGKYKSYYLIDKKDKSAYENEIKSYLSANLSDKAKRQFQINGDVAYGDDVNKLKADYIDFNDNRIKQLKTQALRYQGEIKASDPNSPLVVQFKEQLLEIDDQIKEYEAERDSTNKPDFVNRFESVAGAIYTDKFLSNVSRGNARTDIEINYKPDQVALTQFKEDLENRRFNTRLEFDAEQNMLDRNLKIQENALDREAQFELQRLKNLADGKGPSTFVSSTQTADEENQVSVNNKFINEEIAGANRLKQDAHLRLQREIETVTGVNLSDMKKEERDAFINRWTIENEGKNASLENYKKQVKIANNTLEVYDTIKKEAEAEVAKLYPNDFKASRNVTPFSAKINTLTGGSININLTKEEIIAANQGNNPDIKLSIQEGSVQGRTGGSGNTRYFLNYKGSTHLITQGDYVKLSGLINPTAGPRALINSKINELLSRKATAIREEKLPVGDQDKSANLVALRTDFARETGMKDTAFKDLKVYSVDRNGAYFNLPPSYTEEELGVTRLQMEAIIQAKGGKRITRDGNVLYYIPYSKLTWQPLTFSDPELKPMNDYFNYQKIRSADRGELNTIVKPPKGTVYDPNKINENIQIAMELQNGVPSYFILLPDHKKKLGDLSNGGQGFSSIEDAALYIKNLTKTKELFNNYLKLY